MSIEIETTYVDDENSTCLICKTTYHKGKARWVKGCSCGNIIFFDITPGYVRIGIQYPIVFVSSVDDWEIDILKQISEHGQPLKHKNIDSEIDCFDYAKKYTK